MNGLINQIKSEPHTLMEMICRKPYPPELIFSTWEINEGNLADEIATTLTQPAHFAELPDVAPEDFESLFSWFIS